MESQILWIILLTITPISELRGGIIYGLTQTELHWAVVFIAATVTNMLLGPALYIFIDKMIHVFLRINFVNAIYQKYAVRAQQKLRPYIEKYGTLGVALFIGIPLPATGTYTAAIGSYLLGLKFRQFVIANALGVIIAGVIVTAITVTGNHAVGFFIK